MSFEPGLHTKAAHKVTLSLFRDQAWAGRESRESCSSEPTCGMELDFLSDF